MSPTYDVHDLIRLIRVSLLVQLLDVCYEVSPVGILRRWIRKIHVVLPWEIPISLYAGNLAEIIAKIWNRGSERVWSGEMPVHRGGLVARHPGVQPRGICESIDIQK